MLGQHTEEVLEELLGLDAAELHRLHQKNVI
jgi:crotonobetainyl-CoA:carnitine CoA-transferase CaiB-like acyl-CoA transferase